MGLGELLSKGRSWAGLMVAGIKKEEGWQATLKDGLLKLLLYSEADYFSIIHSYS